MKWFSATSKIQRGDGKMKIKVYLPNGYKIVSVNVADDVKKIANEFQRWEYVL